MPTEKMSLHDEVSLLEEGMSSFDHACSKCFYQILQNDKLAARHFPSKERHSIYKSVARNFFTKKKDISISK